MASRFHSLILKHVAFEKLRLWKLRKLLSFWKWLLEIIWNTQTMFLDPQAKLPSPKPTDSSHLKIGLPKFRVLWLLVSGRVGSLRQTNGRIRNGKRQCIIAFPKFASGRDWSGIIRWKLCFGSQDVKKKNQSWHSPSQSLRWTNKKWC